MSMSASTESPVTLIVGADSMIGGALLAHLRRAAVRVRGTTRREAVSESLLHLDLAQDCSSWQCPEPVDVAVVCAAVSNLEACSRDPVASAKINVQGISALVRNLTGQGAFVIFLSTNQVFDGSLPYRPADDPPSPMTEYGRQKAEAERRISGSASVAIVRLTKVLGLRNSLFEAWAKALRHGKIIHPFADMVMSPVPLSATVSVLRLFADLRRPGIFQFSGSQDISYAETAYLLAQTLEADPDLVQPVIASQSDQYSEFIPRHTTLNMDHLRSALGIEPPTLQWTLKSTFAGLAHHPGKCFNKYLDHHFS
jgi:dTDP-4-dehydrorhamnose reductase